MSEPTSQSSGRYFIETWGCQMNVHDSEKLAGALTRLGYEPADAAGDADVILLNTCSIREKAEEKMFSELGRLRYLKRSNPRLRIGVCGCVAQQEGSRILNRAPYVDFVIGPRATASLPAILARLDGNSTATVDRVDTAYRDDSIRFPYDAIRREGTARGKAFVTIIEGCNHRCTYCIVPTTRGREICRPMPEIIDEVRALATSGVLEIEFLGQTVNAYRDGDGNTLGELLVATAAIDGVERIRFTTSHPAQMTDRLIDSMAAARPALCPYLHLPVQSGSSTVLRAMRRGYDRPRYLDRIARLREAIPEMTFGTDIIVGFPSETEDDFNETLTLLDEMQYDTVYSFAYSERPGTAAVADGDPVPQATKLDRLQRLQAHQRQIQEHNAQRWVGSELQVLVEGPAKRGEAIWAGRTEHNRIVHFSGDATPGALQSVRISAATAFSLRGEPVPMPV